MKLAYETRTSINILAFWKKLFEIIAPDVTIPESKNEYLRKLWDKAADDIIFFICNKLRETTKILSSISDGCINNPHLKFSMAISSLLYENDSRFIALNSIVLHTLEKAINSSGTDSVPREYKNLLKDPIVTEGWFSPFELYEELWKYICPSVWSFMQETFDITYAQKIYSYVSSIVDENIADSITWQNETMAKITAYVIIKDFINDNPFVLAHFISNTEVSKVHKMAECINKS